MSGLGGSWQAGVIDLMMMIPSFLVVVGCRAAAGRAYAAYRRAWWARERERLTANYGRRGTIKQELDQMIAARSA